MKKTKVKRLFHGKASLRNYLVDEALLNHEDLLIVLEKTGEEMIVLYEEIIKKGIWNKNRFSSKHDNRTYVLVDFEFKPSEDKQGRLFISNQSKVVNSNA